MRAGLTAMLAALAWLSWSRNGAVVGVPVVIGLLIGTIYRLTPLRDAAIFRHPAWDRLIYLVYAGAAVLCLESLWDSGMSPGRLDRTAVIWVIGMAVALWALERWEARRQRAVAEKNALPPVDPQGGQ